MIALSVNLNKIALLRNSRNGNYPDVITYARKAIDAGANGITIHPRPDQRHIRPADVHNLWNFLKDYSSTELNIEGNPFANAQSGYPGFLSLIEQYRPRQCTLVPDSNSQLTSDHGFDLKKDGEALKPLIEKIKKIGGRVSLFMDPDLDQIHHAAMLGADRIELYTGPFAEAYANSPDDIETSLLFKQHCQAAAHAHQLGLKVNAGHDLNLKNLSLYRTLPYLQEVSIGHALIVDAINMGFTQAVNAYQKVLNP